MTWVLIIWILASGSGGGNAIAMHDFSSLDTCEAARRYMTAASPSLHVACAPK